MDKLDENGDEIIPTEDVTVDVDDLTVDETLPPEELGDDGQPLSATQKRINALTAKNKKAAEDAAYWRGVAEAGIQNQVTQITPEEEEAELDPDDFDSDADYLKATAKRIEEKFEKKARVNSEREAAKKQSEVIISSAKAGREKYPDFDEVALNKQVPVSQPMFDAALGENLADILYHLGKNPAEAKRIASLPPIQQAKAIGRIEATVTLPTKKVTGAPTPVKVVKGGGNLPPKKDSELSGPELRLKWKADRLKKLGVSTG